MARKSHLKDGILKISHKNQESSRGNELNQRHAHTSCFFIRFREQRVFGMDNIGFIVKICKADISKFDFIYTLFFKRKKGGTGVVIKHLILIYDGK